MIVVFELSLNYSIMPALMLGCVLSTLIAKRFHPHSIYTEPLRLKGVLTDHDDVAASNKLTVGDLMREPAPPLLVTAPFREVINAFLNHSHNFLPVVDANQTMVGVVALQDMKNYLNTDMDITGIIAYDLMRPLPLCLTPQQGLTDVLPQLLGSELRHIPVVNSLEQKKLIGSLLRSEALGLLSEAIAQKTAIR